MALEIKKVLISDKVDSSCQTVLEENSIEVDYKPGLSKDELKAIIKDYDGLIVRSATKVTQDVYDCAERLKIIGRAGTGVDNIDQISASAKGVLVMNTPGGNTLSAAEHTCAMISALARHIGQGYASMLEGKWERSKFMGCELGGKTLAIIGLGRIGREVASRMQSYGMKTVGYDPLVSPEEAATFGVEYLQLKNIWPIADFVTVHVPLIKPTRGMINASVFEVCKPSMKVINVARGGIIDEKDLLNALNAGKCGGAALDVFETEPPKEGSVSMELVKHPKTLCTPHLGASTTEAQLRVAKEIAEQFVDAVNGKPMVGLVNAPALSQLANPLYAPWVELAQKLGSLASNLSDSANLTLHLDGDELKPATRLLNTALCFGLAKAKGLDCNMISAVSLLKEKNIVVVNSPTPKDLAYSALSVSTSENSWLVTGFLSRGRPCIGTLQNTELANPVVLESGLVYAVSDSSEKELLLTSAEMGVSSVSLSRNGNRVVFVASVAEKPANELFKFIQF
ncbi:D-3-phosphoglycerate dehydrogenase-like [Clytia hemisphaerica]|uniref:D-3-phosphoglycerate dehydrogenase n=1 Tax=Clytia hemisphaerica TaxID=252671 RepID=A0A7M5VEV7_9CNID|eukprot:TCONS_00070842-protein